MAYASGLGPATAVGLLTPSGQEHGLNRYSAVLASGLREAGAHVTEERPATDSLRAIMRAVRGLSACDVLHVQHTRDYWGDGWRQVAAVAVLRLARGRRALVVTAHDFHTPHRRWPRSPRAVWRRLRSETTAVEVAHRLLLRSADVVVTCSETELDLLAWTSPRRTAVIAHYVEERPAPAAIRAGTSRHRDPNSARRVVVLGWVHRRKGQHWAVRALAHLPGHELVLAGAANERNGRYLREVLTEGAALGVADRVQCTGYLSEVALDEVLAGAGVGLAPYARIAASGSIATLVAAGVPIVARQTPYLAELAATCPTAVVLYRDDEPALIAEAVRECLEADRSRQRAELAAWAEQHTPLRSGQAHLAAYRILYTPGRPPTGVTR